MHVHDLTWKPPDSKSSTLVPTIVSIDNQDDNSGYCVRSRIEVLGSSTNIICNGISWIDRSNATFLLQAQPKLQDFKTVREKVSNTDNYNNTVYIIYL